MFDRAIGIAGLAIAIIAVIAPFRWPNMPRWITDVGLALGTLLIGVAVGLMVGEFRDHQQQAAVPAPPHDIGTAKQYMMSEFDDIKNFGVSFSISGSMTTSLFSDNLAYGGYITLLSCRFTNLSTIQPRILDIRMEIPTTDPDIPMIKLSTRNYLPPEEAHPV